MKFITAALALGLLTTTAQAQWRPQDSGVTARLRGLCAVNERVAWASGAGGTILRTINGGDTWDRRQVPDAEALDFRDVEALDDQTAWVLSIGPGSLSRIYKTQDGGAIWALSHVNQDPRGFLDAIAFWDSTHGIALGDPVDGRFMVLVTDDGGKTWNRIPEAGMPTSSPGEGAFAASGTCLIVRGDKNAWFGTGGGRVFRSLDRGRTWTTHATPTQAGNGSSGVFSLAFRDDLYGVAVGGDYKQPDARGRNVAVTCDGGLTWTRPEGSVKVPYRSAVAFLGASLVAVGPTGSDRSDDGAETWTTLSDVGFHAVGFASPVRGWAVGDDGRISLWEATRKP